MPRKQCDTLFNARHMSLFSFLSLNLRQILSMAGDQPQARVGGALRPSLAIGEVTLARFGAAEEKSMSEVTMEGEPPMEKQSNSHVVLKATVELVVKSQSMRKETLPVQRKRRSG